MSTRSPIWKSLALLTMVSGAAAAQAPAAGADEQAVTAAEYQWLKAQQTNNMALLAPLFDDRIVETNVDGKVFAGKDAVVADFKSETWSSADYADFKVTVFGHTAIATGTFVGKATDAAGTPLDIRARFTDTWVKTTNGKWLCVASQTTPIKM